MALAACGDDWDFTYKIAGTISGLSAAGLVLQNSGGDDVTVAANASSFQFPTRVAAGGSYNVTVATQPDGLTCTVTNGAGSDVDAVVTGISVACSPVTHTITGTITGLTADGLILQNNDADDLTVPANATTFEFVTPVAAGGGYSVTALSQPTGLTCGVSNGAGSNVRADIGGIQVTCGATAHSIGGTIAGLTGSGLVLQNNGDDDLSVAANATVFEFAAPVAYGGVYAVTILTQPAGQLCTVAQGSAVATTQVTSIILNCADIITYTITASSGTNGSIAPSGAVVLNSGGEQGFAATPAANYAVDQWLLDGTTVQTGGDVYTLSNVSANHTLTVTFARATLTPSVSSMALAVNDTALNAALTGNPRQIVITNTGSVAATNVSIAFPAWPVGTTASTTCGGVLPAASSCTITITPGSTATSNCTTGAAPASGMVTASADDAADSQIAVSVLGYGCIYQGGYIFSIDDSTPANSSIGGKVAALTDQAPAYPNGVVWSSKGDSTVDDVSILGIDETSTASSPSPANPAYPPGTPAYVGCNGSTDGSCNTTNILSYYNFNRSAGGAAPTPLTQYAAGLCGATINGHSDWYLPAICEAGVGDAICDSISPALQNMQSNLVSTGVVPLSGYYSTSTEYSPAPHLIAWIQFFDTSGGVFQFAAGKVNPLGVRCARLLTP